MSSLGYFLSGAASGSPARGGETSEWQTLQSSPGATRNACAWHLSHGLWSSLPGRVPIVWHSLQPTCACCSCESRDGSRSGSGTSATRWLEQAARITAIARMTRPTPAATVTLKRRERPREGGLAIVVVEVRPRGVERAPRTDLPRFAIRPPPRDRELARRAGGRVRDH